MHVETPQSRVRFAVERADITPPVGIYHRMWGAATHDQAAGVHRPLLATAMIFAPLAATEPSPESLQVVITLDHCLMGQREIQQLRQRVLAAVQVPVESLLVLFSHTHAAGMMTHDRVEMPGGELIPGYLERLNATVAELVQQAIGSLRPATIQYARGRCDLAAQRDFWDDQRRMFVCGYYPGAAADDTVIAARAVADDGQTLATIVNYACHPTTLAWENQQISPDYVGAMREVVERSIAAPCVFLQGASGDLGPREGFVGDTEVADRNGRQLGYAALSALESLGPARTRFAYAGPVVSGATLGTWRHEPLEPAREAQLAAWQIDRRTLPLAYRPELPTIESATVERQSWQQQESESQAAGDSVRARDCRAMVERQTRLLARLRTLPVDAFPYRIAVWRMGDAVWLAAQGEPYQQLQTELRQRFPDQTLVVCGLADEWGPSYLPPADLYGKNIYQESIAVVAAGSLERLIDFVTETINGLLNGDSR